MNLMLLQLTARAIVYCGNPGKAVSDRQLAQMEAVRMECLQATEKTTQRTANWEADMNSLWAELRAIQAGKLAA